MKPWFPLLGLAACGPAEIDSDPIDSDTEVAPQVGTLAEVATCEPRGGTGVTPGSDLMRLTLDDPRARCNDGTPAVLYVRRAATSEAANDWVFHIQGGGTCDGVYGECLTRWCDRNEKMSTTRAPAGMQGAGLTSAASANPFGAANQVFFYYCSSDNWAGRVADVVVSGGSEGDDYRASFLGHHILEVAFEALDAGARSDDGTQALPKLTDARRALFTGTSAGCAGVAHNADYVAERLGPERTWIACDANFSPDDADLPDGAARDTYRASRQQRHRSAVDVTDVHLDASCLAAHPGDDAWLCHHSGHVLGNHVVQAPLFARMDLGDGTISGGYLAAGFTRDEFAAAVQVGLLDAAGGAGEERPVQPISVYGPACGQHVGLTNDAWYGEASVRVGPRDLTLAGALVGFVGGTQILAVDTLPPTLSGCVDKTDQTD